VPKVIAGFLFGVDPGQTGRYDFDRIQQVSRSGGNPYLIEKYASCKTPNADRGAGHSGLDGFILSDGSKAGILSARENRSSFDGGHRSGIYSAADPANCATGNCSQPAASPGSSPAGSQARVSIPDSYFRLGR